MVHRIESLFQIKEDGISEFLWTALVVHTSQYFIIEVGCGGSSGKSRSEPRLPLRQDITGNMASIQLIMHDLLEKLRHDRQDGNQPEVAQVALGSRFEKWGHPGTSNLLEKHLSPLKDF